MGRMLPDQYQNRIEQLRYNPIRKKAVDPDNGRAERTKRKWNFVEKLL